MLILFEKMLLLIALLLLGYLCVRLKLVGKDFNKGLSKLVINVFLVGLILSSVINHEMSMSGRDIVMGLLMMTVVFVISLGIGYIAPLLPGMKNSDKGMYRLLVAFMNNGFMGMPLVAAVYGSEAVFFASLSNIPFNLLLYTVGMRMLQPEQEGGFDIKRAINAPIIATLAAVVIFAFNIHMPQLVDDLFDNLSNATVPLAMMCVGMSLGEVSLKEALMQPKLYVLSLLRLIVCPLVTWFVLRFFISDPVMLGTITMICATPSAVICTILGLETGRDGVESSEAIFISTLLSAVTIPVLITVLGI